MISHRRRRASHVRSPGASKTGQVPAPVSEYGTGHRPDATFFRRRPTLYTGCLAREHR